MLAKDRNPIVANAASREAIVVRSCSVLTKLSSLPPAAYKCTKERRGSRQTFSKMIEKAISTFSYLLTGLVLYNIGLTIYRLYFHPLAKSAHFSLKDCMLTATRFPGPKLAAITGWDEFYRDAIQGGRMMWYIQDLHDEYGRVVSSNVGSKVLTVRPDRPHRTRRATHPRLILLRRAIHLRQQRSRQMESYDGIFWTA